MEAAQETMRHRSLAAEFSETNEVDRASGLGYIHVERYRMSAACSVASVCRFSGRGTEQKVPEHILSSLSSVDSRCFGYVACPKECLAGHVCYANPYPTWPGDIMQESTFFCRAHDR